MTWAFWGRIRTRPLAANQPRATGEFGHGNDSDSSSVDRLHCGGGAGRPGEMCDDDDGGDLAAYCGASAELDEQESFPTDEGASMPMQGQRALPRCIARGARA